MVDAMGIGEEEIGRGIDGDGGGFGGYGGNGG